MSEPVPDSTSFNKKRCSSSTELNCKRFCPEESSINCMLSSICAKNCVLSSDGSNMHVSCSTVHSCSNSSSIIQETSPYMHINDLPVLSMLHIFSYLSLSDRQHRVALVCHYWLQLSRDPLLWKSVILRDQRKIADSVLKSVTRFGSVLTILDITDCVSVTDCGLSLVLKTCPRLVKLRLAR